MSPCPDSAVTKGRIQRLQRAAPLALAVLFVGGVCVLEANRAWDPLSEVRGGDEAPESSEQSGSDSGAGAGRRRKTRRRAASFRDEFDALKENTHKLYTRMDRLQESLTGLVKELNTQSELSEALKEKVAAVKNRQQKKRAKFKEELGDMVDDLRTQQEADLKEINDKIDALPKCPDPVQTFRQPAAQLPAGGAHDSINRLNGAANHAGSAGVYTDPQASYGGGFQQEQFGARERQPVKDPCADAGDASGSDEDAGSDGSDGSEGSDGSGEGSDSDAGSGADPVTKCRRNKVREAFLHGWNAYKRDAWGHDELRPMSRMPKDWGGQGMGLSMMDGISTLWLMGLHKEFDEVRQWVATELRIDQNYDVSVFESTIRYVGALVSAYELSGEKHKVFIEKAAQLADKLLFSYNTSTGIPHSTINLLTHHHSSPMWAGGASVLSEFGTVQLELRSLSLHTGNPLYDQKATWIMDIIQGKAPEDMLCPTYFNSNFGGWTTDHVTLGALGDSFYEYLLKQYLLTGQTEGRYRTMYLKSVRSIQEKLVKKSVPGGQTYVAEFKRGTIFNKMDHLACFTGGMFALGTHLLQYDDEQEAADLRTAEELAETCYLMYKNQPSGIAPEIVEFRGGGDMSLNPRSAYYILRPEAIETFMYLYRVTKKDKYRQWGWEVFTHIDRWCRVEGGGHSGVRNVGVVPPQKDDLQQSFWFAETLKYLYILFSDDDLIDFSKWVLNTEAHPMRVRKRDPLDLWSPEERAAREDDTKLSIDERMRRYKVAFERRVAEEGDRGVRSAADAAGDRGYAAQRQAAGGGEAATNGGGSSYMAEQERLVRESRERHRVWQEQQDANYRKSLEAQQQQQQQQQRVSSDIGHSSDEERITRLQHQRNT